MLTIIARAADARRFHALYRCASRPRAAAIVWHFVRRQSVRIIFIFKRDHMVLRLLS